MWQFIGHCNAAASAGPDGKVMIVSHLTNTDGHKVPGTILENMQWLQLEALTFSVSLYSGQSIFLIQIDTWPPIGTTMSYGEPHILQI